MTRALTLHQPWASLIALQVKSIETRSWGTSYRGPLLIHAGARVPRRSEVSPVAHAMELSWCSIGRTCSPCAQTCGECSDTAIRCLPLGVIVASCTLADVVPILRYDEDPSPGLDEWVKHVAPVRVTGDLALWDGPTYPENLSTGRPTWTITDVEAQRPYGDFAPGRFAWLLEDVKPTTERCPRCWGLCVIDPLPTSEMSTEALQAGATIEGTRCPTCGGAGSCDPVPAKGRQGLWVWSPAAA